MAKKFKLIKAGIGIIGPSGIDLTENYEWTGTHTFGDGTEAAPGIGFTAQPGTGFQRSSSAVIDVCLNGTAQVRMASGAAMLRLAGSASSDAARLSFYTQDWATERGYIGFPTASADLMYIRNIVGASLALRASNNTTRLLVDDTTGLTYTAVAGPSGEVGLRRVVRQTTGGTLTADMVGTAQRVTSAVTVPNNVFAGGDALQVVNASGSAINITQGSGVTMYNSNDGTSGTVSLGARGIAYLWWDDTSTVYVGGNVT